MFSEREGEKHEYASLKRSESFENDDSESGDSYVASAALLRHSPGRPNRMLWLTVANLLVLFVSVCFFGTTLYFRKRDDGDLLRKITWNPFVPETFRPRWFTQDFATKPISSPESVFRGAPSPQVDAAWKRVTDIGVLTLTEAEIRAMGKDPQNVVRAPTDWGRGEDAYLGHLDGLHLVHCLDTMRKSLHANFDRYYPDGMTTTQAVHLHHCQEALAKRLMCHPSVEIITYNWAKRQVHPFPDFDTTTKCYGIDPLLKWQAERRVTSMDSDMWNALRIEEGQEPMPVPLLMLEAYNVTREQEADMP